jgi:HK97 family phage major capsid protein
MQRNFKRTFTIQRGESIDVTARTVPLAFSSEAPYERWFGIEILDHSPGSCDLTRLADGRHPLLLNHDTDDQIGVIDSAQIDTDKIGRAIVRFGRGQMANEIFQDVQDGIRSLVSVGYLIDELEADDGEGEDRKVRKFTWDEFETRQRELHGVAIQSRAASNAQRAAGDTDPVFRVTKWTPFEISIVSIPADASVGIGRGASTGTEAATGRVESASSTEQQIQIPQPISQRNITMPDQNNDGVKAEQKRTQDLLAVADSYAQFGARDLVAEFIRNGKSVEAFKDLLMDKISTKHSSARDLEIGLSANETQRYSLQRAIQAAITGNWGAAGLERAASEAVAKRSGMSPEGFFVPVEAFQKMSGSRAFDAGTAGNAGNLIQTNVLGGEFIDVLRNALVLNKLGIRVLGGLTSNIAIPRKTVASTIQNVAETTAFSLTNPNTTQIALTPHRVGAQIPYTKQSLIQSSLDVESMLRDDLAQGIAVMIENLALNGSGTAPAPRGLVNQTGIGAVVGGTNGLQVAWSHIVGLESACANSNAEPDSLAGYIVNTKTRGWMKGTQKATYLPYLWDVTNPDQPLNGYRAAVSNNLPSNGTKGSSAGIVSTMFFGSDWSNFVLALFGGLDIVVDPYSLAGSGQVVLTANQFIDVGVRQPACFSAFTDALTA